MVPPNQGRQCQLDAGNFMCKMAPLSVHRPLMARPVLGKERTTVWLPARVREALVRAAQRQGKTIAEVVEEALIKFLG